MASDKNAKDLLLVDGSKSGRTVIPAGTPLSRLNYFDGKFLRAEDFAYEQKYLQEVFRHSNRGLGSGVVYGFDTTLASGDQLQLGPGLAVDPMGDLILLPQTLKLGIADLIDATRKRIETRTDSSGKKVFSGFGECVEVVAPPPTDVLPPSDLYVIAVCRAEALCGQEDVFGKLCEDACVSTSGHPYRKEGLVVRALPLQLRTPFPTSKAVSIDGAAFLRSKVAHAFFADEVLKHPDAINAAGLKSHLWCLGAGYDASCCEVPLAVVARSGSSTVFLDAWIVRRERMDAPAKRYWQWKMRMRPWDVFLAQVLQFQCQLADVLAGHVDEGEDPCRPAHEALSDVATFLNSVDKKLLTLPAENMSGASLLGLSFTQLAAMRERIDSALKARFTSTRAMNRILIQGGILETPPGGYLPVVPTSDVSVNAQVRALLGEGLDYRFCVVRPDFVAHALEEVQHMDRISLLEGIDDPTNKPKIDVLVPDGRIVRSGVSPDVKVFRATVKASSDQTGGQFSRGAAREARAAGGGHMLWMAGAGEHTGFGAKLVSALRAEKTAEPLTNLQPNLDPERTFRRDPTSTTRFETMLRETVASARTWVANTERLQPAPTRRTSRSTSSSSELRVAVEKPSGAVGCWIEGGTERRLRELRPYEQTPFHVRFDQGWFNEGNPMAMEITLKGVFTASTNQPIGDGRQQLKGRFLGMFTTRLIAEAAGDARDQVVDHNARMDMDAAFAWDGTEADGETVFECFPSDPKGAAYLKAIREVHGAPHQVVYTLKLARLDDGEVTYQTLWTMSLDQDADVLRPDNAEHRLADQGMQILYASLDMIEPQFLTDARAKLFPVIAPPDKELTIQAVHDWVLFHRRREKQCTEAFTPVVPLPAKTYRVLNVTYRTEDEAKAALSQFRDARMLSAALKKLRPNSDLLIRFEGGTARPLFDRTAAAKDWERMGPGDRIVGVVYGAVDERDVTLQRARVDAFEFAIVDISTEDRLIGDVPYAPLPDELRPPGADGLMIFATVRAVDTQSIYRIYNNANDSRLAKLFIEALTKNDPTTREEVFRKLEIKKIGEIEFRGGTAELEPGTLDPIADALEDDVVVSGVVLWESSTDPAIALRLPQAKAALAGLGSHVAADVQPVERKATGAIAGDAPSALFLHTRPHVEKQLRVVVAVRENATHHYRVVDAGTGKIENDTFDSQAKKAIQNAETPNTRFRGVTLATVEAPDSVAKVRAKAALDLLISANRAPAEATSEVVQLSPEDKHTLDEAGISVSGLDEVYFLERI